MAEETNVLVDLIDVRTSYFYGHEPYRGDDGKNSFCSHFLLPKTHPSLPAVQAAIKKVAQGLWKDKALEMLAALAGQDRICLHKGDVSKPGEDAYKGLLYISGNSKNRFTMVETRGGVNVPLTAADARPYSGCHVNAKVAIWAQQNKWGKRINAQIQGVQFIKHNTAFGGGRVSTIDEFGIVPTDADGAAPGGFGTSEDLSDQGVSDLLG